MMSARSTAAGRARPLRRSASGSPLFGLVLGLVVALPVLVAAFVLTQTGILEDEDSGAGATVPPALFESAGEPLLALGAEDALAEATAALTAAPTEEAPALQPQVYLVQAGDTLSVIARNHGTTVAALVAYNQLPDRDALRIGQELKIPPPGYEPPSPATPAAAGETASPAPESAPGG